MKDIKSIIDGRYLEAGEFGLEISDKITQSSFEPFRYRKQRYEVGICTILNLELQRFY